MLGITPYDFEVGHYEDINTSFFNGTLEKQEVDSHDSSSDQEESFAHNLINYFQ